MRLAAKKEWDTVIPTGAILPGYELLGDLYQNLGEHKKAIAAYEKSLTRETARRNSISGIIRSAEAIAHDKKRVYYDDVLKKISLRK